MEGMLIILLVINSCIVLYFRDANFEVIHFVEYILRLATRVNECVL